MKGLSRDEIRQVKQNVSDNRQIYKGSTGLWYWKSGGFGSYTGFATKAEAEKDCAEFIRRDVRTEASMKTRGKQDIIRLSLMKQTPKPRSEYPQEVLAIAYQLAEETSDFKVCAVNACQYAVDRRITTQQLVDAGMARAVALDMAYYKRKREKAAIV